MRNLLPTSFLILGLLLSVFTPAIAIERVTTTDLPSVFSWRDRNGIDYTTPVKNQAPAPTCETYALCASLETIIQYQTGELFEPDLSETHLYFYAGGTYERGGVNVMDACEYLVEYGVPDEGCYPDPHRPFDYPFESLPGWENRTVKISEWGWINNEDEEIKQALIDYGPLVICISVYEDFLSYRGGVYTHTWGGRAGGHLVALFGYDDNEQSWLCKNSWGTDWGEGGWFRMSYDAGIFIDRCYGGESGIIYLDGVYGTFQPDVPRIRIESPKIYHTYLAGIEIPILLKKLPIQKGAPRLFGKNTLHVSATNTQRIEIYLDGDLQYNDEVASVSWEIAAQRGLHTIEVYGYNDNAISMDILDIFVF